MPREIPSPEKSNFSPISALEAQLPHQVAAPGVQVSALLTPVGR